MSNIHLPGARVDLSIPEAITKDGITVYEVKVRIESQVSTIIRLKSFTLSGSMGCQGVG